MRPRNPILTREIERQMDVQVLADELNRRLQNDDPALSQALVILQEQARSKCERLEEMDRPRAA